MSRAHCHHRRNAFEAEITRLNFFTLDVIGDMGFSLPMGFVKELSDATLAQTRNGTKYRVSSTINSIHRGVRYGFTMANIPSQTFINMVNKVLTALPVLARRIGKSSGDDFENICIDKLRRRIEVGDPERPYGDFMSFILRDRIQPGQGDEKFSFSREQFQSLVADSMMVMNAGSDTTAAALTSTMWFLLRTPTALQRLREELSSIKLESQNKDSSPELSIWHYDEVRDLPYLRACIDESLRLRPPIAYQLPRLISRPTKIAGHDILPGTVVAVAPYSVHRHPSLYRDPDEYQPGRWIDFDEQFPKQREDLKAYNIVFSQGSRACIGRHLAIMELQILIPSLVMR